MFLENISSKVRVFIEYTLYLFIGLFPFILYDGFLYSGTSSRAVTFFILIEVIALVLGLSLLSSKSRLSVTKSPINLALLIFMGVMFISSLLGVDFGTSFWSKAARTTGLFFFLHAGIFYLLLSNIFNEAKKLQNLIKIFLVSSGVFSVLSFLSGDGIGLFFNTESWTTYTFGNTTFAAMYMFAAFTLSIYYVWSQSQGERKWWEYLIPISLIINPYIINRDLWLGKINVLNNPSGIIGEAKATSYALFFSIFILLFFLLFSKIKSISIRRKIIWGSVASGAIFASIAVYSFFSPAGFLQEAYLKQASGARPILWELSGSAIKDMPVFGWGVDNYDQALQKYYDNRILEKKNGAEQWFDRAHNVFIDQTVDIGYVGLTAYILIYLVIIGCMIFILFKSKEKKDQLLATLIIVYFLGHLIELQTAFDTVISYIPLIFMTVIASVLFHKNYRLIIGEKSEWVLSSGFKNSIAVALIGFSIIMFFFGTLSLTRAEIAHGGIRSAGISEKRQALYQKLFSSPVDLSIFVWNISRDIKKGILGKPEILDNKKEAEGLKKEFDIFASEYEKYLERKPNDYRARTELVGIYLFQHLFGVDQLDKAHKVLDEAVALNSNIPQAYWEKSVTYLLQGKFALARSWAKDGLDLNPNIEQSQRMVQYIEESIKTFPEINLFTF